MRRYLLIIISCFCSELPGQGVFAENIPFTASRKLNQVNDLNWGALSKLYSDLKGSEWSRNSNWMDGLPCNTSWYNAWYGITCSGDHITRISLSYNSLEGTIPSQIGLLSNISYFKMSSNNITGSLPSQIGMMTSFTSYNSFYINSNSLTGELPSEIGLMIPAIGDLYLNSNSFSGHLPSEIGLMVASTANLQIYSNALSGSIPSEFGQLTSMNMLNLVGNVFSGSIPSQMGLMTGLQWLFYLSHMSLTGSIPSELGQLTGMYYFFSINNNQLTGEVPSELGRLSQMYNGFNLGSNSLTGTLPSELGQLTDIGSSFMLYGNSFHGAVPSELGRFSLLGGYFYLDDNSFSGSLPSEFGSLTACSTYFRVDNNNFSGSIPSEMGRLNLTVSEYHFQNNIFHGSIPSQLGEWTGMTSSLHLHSNSLTGSLPSQLGRLSLMVSHLGLQSLILSGPIPSELGSLTGFVSNFSLFDNHLSSTLPSELGQMTAFSSHFYINNNNITGHLPTELGQMRNFSDNFGVYNNDFCGDIPTEVIDMLSSVWNVNLEEGNHFGTPCCEVFTSVYTCAPTMVPSPEPSPVPTVTFEPSPLPTISLSPTSSPTPLPSASPTPLPSMSPSPLPSLIPTFSQVPSSIPTISLPPTAVPTMVPTSTPTSTPTILPSPVPSSPTPVPTVSCQSGSYYNGVSCISCAVGRFTKFNSPPFPTSCELCPSGRYNTQSNLTCTKCATGKLSSPDRTYCADCSAGEYSFNDEECVECEYGKYAPQALSDSCLTCTAGSHTNLQVKATTCISCDAGSYSSNLSFICSDCSVGKYSSSGAVECTNCAAGFVSPKKGASTCEACSAGYYSSVAGNVNCSACAVGTFQGSTGQSKCNDCESGKYGNELAQTSCLSCSSGKTSKASSTSCQFAEARYYVTDLSKSDVMDCPKHAECKGSLNTPIPNRNFWVDHSSIKYAGDMYKCSRATCIGGQNHSTCWTLHGFNATECLKLSELQCAKGSRGPLCASCEEGYVYTATSASCEDCAETTVFTYLIISCLCGLVLLCVAFYNLSEDHQLKQRFRDFIHYVDGGSLKVLWVTSQIIVSSSFNLDIKFPSPFRNMLSFMSVFSFDFLALECLYENGQVYFSTVYVWCIVPIVIAAIIVLVGVLRVLSHYSSNFLRYAVEEDMSSSTKASVARATRTKIINQHTWLLLFLSYIVLPPVSNKQLQIFDCLSLKSDQVYLRADTSINCDQKEYYQFRSAIIFFIALYQLIPLTWLWLLYRNKEALNPPTANKDEHLSLFIRDNNADLASLRFLFLDYTCDKWWFEIAEMYRRIIFIGILPLVSRQSSTRASFGCFLAILSVVYFSENKPYRVRFTNLVAFVAQVCILVTFYGALTIETDSLVTFGLTGFRLGVFLLFVNLAVFLLVFWFSFSNFLMHREAQALMEQQANYCERAIGFSKLKFKTTFDAIWLRSIPSAEALVCYYTTSEKASRARKAGISALKHFNGIPFTLRQPHYANANDLEVFGDKSMQCSSHDAVRGTNFPNEELLILSLPRQFLRPLPGYEDDDGLCMISAEVLIALRPSNFIGVVDKQPWLNQQILLPPHCIIRSFTLYEKPLTAVEERDSTQLTQSLHSRTSASSFRMAFQFDTDTHIKDESMKGTNFVKPITDIASFLQDMNVVRFIAKESKLFPLFHYTSRSVAPLILKSGLRMSSQGQGDGGVYVSTQSPASYGLGTPEYEVNIIKDCFGAERIDEYKGKGNLDVIIVYGCVGRALEQTPGGRLNAKMYSKASFSKFSLPHYDGNFFLRPDRILGCFVVDHDNLPRVTSSTRRLLENEKQYDQMSIERLNDAEAMNNFNALNINKAIIHYNSIVDADLARSVSEEMSQSRSRSRSATSPHSQGREFEHMRFPRLDNSPASFKKSVEMVHLSSNDRQTSLDNDDFQEGEDKQEGLGIIRSFLNSRQSPPPSPGLFPFMRSTSDGSSENNTSKKVATRQSRAGSSGSETGSPPPPPGIFPRFMRSGSTESDGRQSSVDSPRLDLSELYNMARGRSRSTSSISYLEKDDVTGGTMV